MNFIVDIYNSEAEEFTHLPEWYDPYEASDAGDVSVVQTQQRENGVRLKNGETLISFNSLGGCVPVV